MEENKNLVELLVEDTIAFSKASIELYKLKALEKSSDVVSTIVPHTVVVILVIMAALFVNIGLAIWLGDVFGQLWLGFFAVAALYGVLGIVVKFFMHAWMKNGINNYIIKQVMK